MRLLDMQLPAFFLVQLPRQSEAAEEAGASDISHYRWLLMEWSVYFFHKKSRRW
jgi:hypothetical protein